MKQYNLFLLCAALFSPSLNVCMMVESNSLDKTTSDKPAYITALKTQRDTCRKLLETRSAKRLDEKLNRHEAAFLQSIYFVQYVPAELNGPRTSPKHGIRSFSGTRMQGCSALGMVTMAPYITLQIKQEYAEKLNIFGFKPTTVDKGFAFLEKEERVFNKMLLLHYATIHNLGVTPKLLQKLITSLYQLMSDIEKPLF